RRIAKMPFRASCHAIHTSGQRTLAASAPENGNARAWYFDQRRHSLCGLDVLVPHKPLATNVRFGSKADICNAKSNARFTPISDRESGRALGNSSTVEHRTLTPTRPVDLNNPTRCCSLAAEKPRCGTPQARRQSIYLTFST